MTARGSRPRFAATIRGEGSPRGFAETARAGRDPRPPARRVLEWGPVQRVLLVLGAVLVAVGLAWPWLSRLPLGRLPGDLRFGGDGWSVSIPVVTCLVLSVVLTLLLWLLRR